MANILHKRLSNRVIDAAFKVHSTLGPGLAEVLYKRALMLELHSQGIAAEKEKPFSVFYAQKQIGKYFADIVVENTLILEIKVTTNFNSAMQSQLFNYLRISGLNIGYLCNFYPHIFQFKRFVL